KDKKTAEAKFKEINEAYEVLGDAEKRKKYDELGADWDRAGGQQPPPGWGMGGEGFGGGGVHFGGTGFSDFFEQFFGGGFRNGGQRGNPANPFAGFGAQEGPERGSDIEADLLVTIEEALHGAKKKISFRRDGKSKVETYEVKIPKGVREGQRIRLAGQGEAGSHPGHSGDLYLRVRFAQHPDYQIENGNLIYELEVPAWKAVLGAEATVTTPDGTARLKIPPGTQPGQRFRLKGRGLPLGPNTRGDFYVVAEVSLPTELSDEERRLWEAIAKEEAD
ncbi:MAG TPA: DnaJ C-terminal domain-containing protein, partial [Chthoniobacteraceae bacterium]